MHLINDFQIAKEKLDDHQVIAFPTETVMGFGIYYDDKDAYNRLNTIKGRPENKPYTLMLSDICDIEKFAFLSNRDKKIISAFMPGPVTLLLNAKDSVPFHVTHGTKVIGVRIPKMDVILKFINYCGKPLLVPSANKSGEKPLLTSEEVKDAFNNEIAFVFGGDSLGEKPSTIIDLTSEEVKILREGPISLSDVNKILKGDF